ncbi:MlaD family protein [Mycolicibacterium litorale]|uniref:Mammalian cell entry protein n=1 Tax=Mycolicibacterium litorale TaxID=758802 RepID=A0AAD1IQP1_9MYCO|nr:MCE family protein [Mycolicibacterium litorale]MCV7416614.1 MCE family protein [Mycolicibacterium litorale]TDY09866.1 ABC-type transporter Mla subunit MlaD [Mycolicibacterium litorale]BBY17827.1 mammalian cell entry protein [Mycolicibacterium litorale]
MANSFELDGRGPTDRQLLACGAALLVVVALVSAALLVKSTGRLDAHVRVVAALVNVGDGLPQRSDVKYHGVLVGAVTGVTPAQYGDPNFVHIDLKPEFAASIPAGVTARVVPSNVFAVSSVQLVDRSGGPAIAPGAHIPEDTELPTVLFQTTISKLRDILAATGRGREDDTVGILAAVNAATQGRRAELLTGGAQLNRIVDELDRIVATEPGPTTVSALVDATRGLQQTAPELVDALHQAVAPMQTLVEQSAQLTTLVNGGIHTVGNTHTALGNHTDRMVRITHELTPVLGSLADTSRHWVPAFVKLNDLSRKFFDEVWIPEQDIGNMRVNLSFTPTYSYTRADCPQYAGLKGPSCYTAPLVPTRAELPDVLLPQNYQPPADLRPPPGTEVGPNGNLVAVGPPLVNPNPDLRDPNPPLPPWMAPSPPVPGTANPALTPVPPPPVPLSPPAPVAPRPGDLLPAEAAPAAFGGNVGPVGSRYELDQLGLITGGRATVATQLLLGPVARGTTVSEEQQ